METDRRFCRFSRSADRNALGLQWGEDDGFCLSSFVIVTSQDDPRRVLVGKMNPDGPWDHAGGLDADRVRVHMNGWMLPACQLLLRESPDAAAHRILAEMLGGIAVPLEPPRVVSEVYAPRRNPNAQHHWDLSFLYRGRWAGPAPVVPELWRELRFVDVRSTPRSEFARSHEEVLDLVGLGPGSPSPS